MKDIKCLIFNDGRIRITIIDTEFKLLIINIWPQSALFFLAY